MERVRGSWRGGIHGGRKSMAWPRRTFRGVYTITLLCFRQFVQREFISATTPVFKGHLKGFTVYALGCPSFPERSRKLFSFRIRRCRFRHAISLKRRNFSCIIVYNIIVIENPFRKTFDCHYIILSLIHDTDWLSQDFDHSTMWIF